MAISSVFPLEGGCDCGRVRYRMERPPLFVHCCHCRWCQRESGASFALNAMIEADRLTGLGAAHQIALDTLGPGQRQHHAFRAVKAAGKRLFGNLADLGGRLMFHDGSSVMSNGERWVEVSAWASSG